MIKRAIFIIQILLLFLLGTGCGQKTGLTENEQNWLRSDAREGLQAAWERDFRLLSIVSGNINRLHSSDQPAWIMGKAIGAIEAFIYTDEREYQRLDDNRYISVEDKKNLISPGLLTQLLQTRPILNHIKQDILEPWSQILLAGQLLTVEQEKVVEQTRELLQRLTESYSRLAIDWEKLDGNQKQGLVQELGKIQEQLQKLSFPRKG